MNERKYFQKYKYQKYIDGVAQSEYQTGDSRQTMISNLTDCQTGANVEWVVTEDTFLIVNENGQWCKYLNPKRKKVNGVLTDIYMLEPGSTPTECGESLDDMLVGRYDMDGDPDYFICEDNKLYHVKKIMASNGQVLGEYKGDYYAPCTSGCSNKEQTKTETSTYQQGIYEHTVIQEYETKDCGNTWQLTSFEDSITCIGNTDGQIPMTPVFTHQPTTIGQNYIDDGDMFGGFDENGKFHLIISDTSDTKFDMYLVDMTNNTVTHEGSINEPNYVHGTFHGQCSYKINSVSKTATGIGSDYYLEVFDFNNGTISRTATQYSTSTGQEIYGFTYDWSKHGFVVSHTVTQSPSLQTLFIYDDGSYEGTPIESYTDLGTRINDISAGYSYANEVNNSFGIRSNSWFKFGTHENGGHTKQTRYTQVDKYYGSGVATLRTAPVLEDGATASYSENTATADMSESKNRFVIHVTNSTGGEVNFARFSINDCGVNGLYIYDGNNIRLITDYKYIICVEGNKICRIDGLYQNNINFIFY